MHMRDQFNAPELYDLSLTHRGVDAVLNNQRLEFLGDRVLGLVIADMLYAAFPGEREGDMAKRHAALVCGDALVEVATQIRLRDQLILADGEEHSGGRDNASNLEDACEALIGALYLDGGLEAAESFIRKYWQPLLAREVTPPKDAKTALQEWAQGQGLPLPDYAELSRSGPAHAPEFEIRVRVEGYPSAQGSGHSKRDAQQAAAQALLDAAGAHHD